MRQRTVTVSHNEYGSIKYAVYSACLRLYDNPQLMKQCAVRTGHNPSSLGDEA